MTTILTTLNEKMDDIMKIIKSLEESRLFIKGISKTIQNKIKEQRGGFLSMLLGTLGVSLLENLLPGKWVMRPSEGTIRAGEGTIRASKHF